MNRSRLISLAAIAVLPSLAACAGASTMAGGGLEDACVLTSQTEPARAQPPQPDGFVNLDGRMVPYHRVTGTRLSHRMAIPPRDPCEASTEVAERVG